MSKITDEERRIAMGKASRAYTAIHSEIRRKYGRASFCENKDCNKKSKIFEWSFKHLGQPYTTDIKDYQQLCRSCHRKYDLDNNIRPNNAIPIIQHDEYGNFIAEYDSTLSAWIATGVKQTTITRSLKVKGRKLRCGLFFKYKSEFMKEKKKHSAEEILDKHYQPKMHWKSVNRENILNAMAEYASIVNCDQDRINYYEDKIEMLNRILSEKDKEISEVNERKDNAGVWVKASERLPNKLDYYNCRLAGIPVVFWIDHKNEAIISEKGTTMNKILFKSIQWLDESQPTQKEVDGN